ncbi:MAG: hypothetical protein V1756_01800 [Patescibacteria group bacterium]
MVDKLINDIRKALEPVWNKACVRGRCWGQKIPYNIHGGPNIVMMIGNDIIFVSLQKNNAVLYRARLVQNNQSCVEVEKALRAAFPDIKIIKPPCNYRFSMADVAVIKKDWYWIHQLCGAQGGFDEVAGTDGSDEYRRDGIAKIIEAHAEQSGDCSPEGVKVFYKGEEKFDLEKLISLTCKVPCRI